MKIASTLGISIPGPWAGWVAPGIAGFVLP